MKKRVLWLLLSLAMVLALLPAALAAEGSKVIAGEIIELGTVGLSSTGNMEPFSMENGGVDLVEGENPPRWIDRVVLPDYAKKLYAVLEEAVDNDGFEDYLIGEDYFSLDNLDSVYSGEPGSLIRAHVNFSGGTSVDFSAILVTVLTGEASDRSSSEYKYAQSCIWAVCNAFDRDHPEVFWLNGNKNTYSISSGTTRYVYLLLKNDSGYDFRISEFQTTKAITDQMKETEADIQAILGGIPQNASRYETLDYFNTWLTTHNEYNTGDLNKGPWDMREACNALEGKVGTAGPVCESYARALKVLCDRAGIPCVLVDGDATSDPKKAGGAHMWNYVQMEDGNWYAVDTTWNDPTGGAAGAISGNETDKWLLLGEQTLVNTGLTFIDSHPVSNKVSASADGVSFTNGPVLSPTAYATLTYPAPADSLTVGQQVNLTVTRSPQRKTDLQTYSYAASGLPAGLSINESTGAIIGAPTAVTTAATTASVTLMENGIAATTCTITFPAIAAKPHDHITDKVDAKAATCTEPGNEEYWVCSVCGGLFSDSQANNPTTLEEVTLQAKGHQWGNAAFSWTKTDAGYTATATRTCGNDITHGQTVTAAVTSVRTEPTCDADGSIVYTAAADFGGDVKATDTKTVTLSALGHSWGAAAFTWNTETSGNYTATAKRTCIRDAKHTQIVEASVTSNRTEPTCEENGSIVYTATADFGGGVTATDTNSETIPALGHSWGAAEFTWTETSGNYTATAVRTCIRDAKHTQTVEASVTSNRTEPTCDADGSIVYTATADFGGGVKATDTKTVSLSALGHSWGAAAFTWTETSGHYTATAVRTCIRDAKHTQIVEASVTSNRTEPTCEENGSIVYTATADFGGGVTATDTNSETIPALGHSWGAAEFTWTETSGHYTATAVRTCKRDAKHTQTVEASVTSNRTEPTCEESGSIVYTATADFGGGVTATDTNSKTLPALGHSWGAAAFTWNTETSGNYTAIAKRTCIRDAKHTQIVEASVTSNRTEPTCEENGSIVYTATADFGGGVTATATNSETIPALGHSWGDAEFTWSETSGNYTATAARTCGNNGSHTQTATVTMTSEITQAAACTEAGVRTWTATATFEVGATESETKDETLSPLGHDWDDAVFTWTETPGNYAATASRTCKNDGSHQESGTVTVTSEITQTPAGTVPGVRTWTAVAVFGNGATAMAQKEETFYAVIGKVVANDGVTAVPGVTVKLMQGKATAVEGATDANGYFFFDDVLPGAYHLVITGGATTKTDLVTVTDGNVDLGTVRMPHENVNSLVEFQGDDTPAVAVGGVGDFAEAIADEAGEDVIVTVTMTVEEKEPEAESKTEIDKAAAGKTVGLYLDLSLTVSIGSASEEVTDTNGNILEIVVPYDFTGRKNVTVYRYHGGEAAALTGYNSEPSEPKDGSFWCDTTGGLLHIYASKFSTYAVAHNEIRTITVAASENGSVTVSETTAAQGDKITVTALPDAGYTVGSVVVKDPNGKTVSVTKNGNNTYSFTMPDADVTVTAVFDKVEETTPSNPNPPGAPADPGSPDAPGGESAFSVTVIRPENGSAAISPNVEQAAGGERITIIPTPEEGYEVGAVTVTANGREIAVTDNGDGTWSFTMPDADVAIEVTFTAVEAGEPCDGGKACPSHRFTDVDSSLWYHEAVDYMVENGIMIGDGKLFNPNVKISRAEFVLILYRISGDGAVEYSNEFSDVPEGAWYTEAVAWAVDKGITVGNGAGRFMPTDEVTRQDMVLMMYRYARYMGEDVTVTGNLSAYSDTGSVAGYAVEAMTWAVANGVIRGTEGRLNPVNNALRVEVAQMIMNYRRSKG